MVHHPCQNTAIKLALSVLFLIVHLPARADNPTAPGDGLTEGDSAGAFSSAGVVQVRIPSADFANLDVGDTITGIRFRLDSSQGAFAGATYNRFDITLGPSAGTLSSTFAENFTSSPTTVRTGSLGLVSGDYSDGGSPNNYGSSIPFTTSYVYTGGDLLIEIRFDTDSGSISVDGVSTSGGTSISNVGSDTANTANTSEVSFSWAVAFDIVPAGSPYTEVVVPPAADGVEGSSTAPIQSTLRNTTQQIFRTVDLPGLEPGDTIVGMDVRLNEGVLGSKISNITDFIVRMGQASPGFSITGGTAYADNYSGTPVTVRSGLLILSLTATPGGPKPFGGFIQFSTPFTYEGGDLVLETRYSSTSANLILDQLEGDGNSGDMLFSTTGFSDTTSDGNDPGANWAVRFQVIPGDKEPGDKEASDTKAPVVLFRGRPILKPGKRPTRVRGIATDNEALSILLFRASTKDKRRLVTSASSRPFAFKFRNKKGKRKVQVIVTAIDASGNAKRAKRVFR